MSFRPPSGTTSTEKIEDASIRGFTFTERTEQFVQGGSIRMLPQLTGDYQRLGAKWPELNWDVQEEFPPLVEDVKQRWGLIGKTLEFNTYSGYLKFDLTGDINFLFQTAGGAAGKTRFGDNADNAVGYVLETRFQVADSPTGDARNGASMLFDDGVIRDEIKFTEDRVYLKSDPDVGISGVFTSPKDFRVMVRGNDLWMWVEGSEGLAKTGALQNSSSIKSLQLGAPTGGVTADVRFDYLYQRYNFTSDSPVDLAMGFGFSTTEQSCGLPVHAPAKAVAAWDKVIIETDHGESNLEIVDAYVFAEDFDGKADNTDLLVTEPSNWVNATPGGGGMNIDFGGPVGYVHSSSQYVRFAGGDADFKADHYAEVLHGPVRISDGAFIADVAGRYNPYVILRMPRTPTSDPDNRYAFVLQWADTSGISGTTVTWVIEVWDFFTLSSVATLASTSETVNGVNQAFDGKRIRGEVRGDVVSFYCDFLDGAGLTKVLEAENTSGFNPPSDGTPAFWFGPVLGGAPQVCNNAIEMGNFEGETNTLIGTTRLRVEYSHDRGVTWSLGLVETINQVPLEEVDISSIPVIGGGADALRFTVEQVSPGGLAEPIRVKQATVKASYDVSGVELYPEWGPRIGGTSVAATLRADAKQNCGSIPQLSTFTAYGSAGAETSLTGEYNRVTDFPGMGKAYGTPALVGAPSIFLDEIAIQGDGVYNNLPAQAVHANSGEGLLYSNVSDSGRNLLSGYLLVQEGSVQVQLDSDVHVFRKGTYVDLRALGLIWESAGAYSLRFLGNEAGTVWKHRTETSAPWTFSPAEFVAAAVGHVGLQGWVYLEGIGSGEQPIFSSLEGTGSESGMEIGVDSDGRPYFRVRDAIGSEDSVTGEFPLTVGEIAHLSASLTGYDDSAALQLLLNGETCGQKRTQVQASQVGDGRNGQVGARPETVGSDPRSAVRCTQVGEADTAPDADRVVVELGLANPVFELDRNWPVRTSNRLLLDLDRKEGAVRDRSGHGNYPVVPEAYRRRTQRGADGYWGRSTFFVSKEGGMEIPWSEGLSPDTGLTVSLFAKTYTDPSADSILWSQIDNSGDGWEMALDSAGRAKFVVHDGGSNYVHTHTGALLGINSWRPAMFKYDPAAGTVRSRVGDSAWEDSTGFPSIADMSGVSHWLGRGTFGLLDNVAWHRELLADSLWDTLTGETAKYTPAEPVTLRGTTVDDVRHWDVDQKFFRTPAVTVLGDADVAISSHGKSWPAVRPFYYSDTYSREVDPVTIVGQVCGTKSPFRVGNRVPDGGVNLALINSPSMSVPSNVSFHNLSAEEIANIAFYNQGDFIVQGPEVTGENSGEFFYEPSIDTEEIRISNRSVMRQNFKQPKPLFYMHLIGRGRRYVYNPDALDSTDADLIRQNIRIETFEGETVSLEDFGWDVEVQVVDYFNNLLPANHFSVILYCERIPHGETLFVVYDGADARQGYLRDLSRREVINPVPIFTKIPSSDMIDDFEYSMDLDTGGSYSLRIDRS